MTNPPDASHPLAANAYAPPPAPLPGPRKPLGAPSAATISQRVGGGLMLAKLVLLFVAFLVAPRAFDASPLGSPSAGVVSAVLDLVIGISLLLGSRKLLGLAIVRFVLGFVFLTLWSALSPRGTFFPVAEIVMCAAFLLLLVGDAGKPRMALGGWLFGLYALVYVSLISGGLTGKSPLAALVWSASGAIEPGPAGVVTGEAAHYRLRAPSDRWHLRNPASAKKDNPLADRWITRPDLDAHVIVIVEKAPGALVRPDALAKAMINNVEHASSAFEVVAREPMRSHPEAGRIVHMRTTTRAMDLEYVTGVVGVYERAYQILAFAPRRSFAEVEAELRSAVESFELPTDETPGLPPDVEPTPIDVLTGLSVPYTLKAPSKQWYKRKDEAVKKDNAIVDQSMVRPDKEACVFVVAEQVPGAVMDLEKYTDAVLAALGEKSTITGKSCEPMRTNPKEGKLCRVSATVNGLQLEYDYGLFTRGERAFQVIAFASTDVFESVSSELLQAVESFEMPEEKGKK